MVVTAKQFKFMNKNYLLLVFLVTLSLAQVQIKVVRSGPNILNFPQIKSNLAFHTTLQDRPNGVRAEILNTIRGWVSNVDQEIRGTTSKIDKVDRYSSRCQVNYFWFQQKIDKITRVYSDSRPLVPATVIQIIDPSNFAKGILSVYIPDQKRNPINITISNGLTAEFINVTSPFSFNQQINSLILKNTNILNSAPIQMLISQPQTTQKLLRDLGLSSIIYEQLAIASSNSNQISQQEKIVIVLFQKLFSAAVNFPVDKRGISPTIPQTILSHAYTIQDFFQNSIWGPRKIPQIISQSNYGRLLLLSMDSNFISQKIKQKLQSCFSNGAANMACFQAVMNEIKTNPTLRYYVAGVQPSSVTQSLNTQFYRETVNWKKVFFAINDKNVDFIRPLSATMLNFLGNKFVQTQSRYFSTIACRKSAAIQIKISSIIGSLSARIKKMSQTDFGPIILNTDKPDTINIDQWLQAFQINFILVGKQHKGKRFFFTKSRPTFQKQLKMSIIIDGQIKFQQLLGNRRGNNKEQYITLTIDPIKGTVR